MSLTTTTTTTTTADTCVQHILSPKLRIRCSSIADVEEEREEEKNGSGGGDECKQGEKDNDRHAPSLILTRGASSSSPLSSPLYRPVAVKPTAATALSPLLRRNKSLDVFHTSGGGGTAADRNYGVRPGDEMSGAMERVAGIIIPKSSPPCSNPCSPSTSPHPSTSSTSSSRTNSPPLLSSRASRLKLEMSQSAYAIMISKRMTQEATTVTTTRREESF